ncbi:MAG: hypothetical protein M1608_02955, partial [Candidatus Omnitrophica bacterium]|nr:hypothetical protein [Candidatus Omnitrophota bacterium]
MNAPETIRPGQVRSRWQVYPTVWGVCYWACLLWLGGMLLIPRAAAFQFDVFLGYDGVVREENWFPVVCEVANDGPAFQAVFEVENSYSQSSQTRRLVLELPTNTRKRFVLPVFSSGRYSAWNARLLDERGKVRAESTGLRAQQDAQANGFLLGAVPRSFSGLPVLPGETDSRRSSQIYVCHIRPELFPDNPIALEGLNALYVDSEMALQLKPPQVEAILAWLYGGGHLIISVEQLTDVNGTPWLRSLMPCELSGTTAAFSQDDLMQWLKGDAGVAGQAPAVEAEPVPARASPRAPNRTYGITPEMARRYGLRPGLRPASSPESPPPDPFANLRPDPAFDQGSISVVTGPLRDGRVLCSMQGQPILVRADRG